VNSLCQLLPSIQTEKSFTPEGFKETVTPKAMTLEEIKQTVLDFKNAAKNAMDAGFDGVEIHSSNGYLFHQFFNGTSNVRTDQYGGTIENKARILFEVIDAIKEVMPENRIGLRLNPSLHGIFGMTMDAETIPTFDYIIKKLNEYNLAYLHLSEPFNDVSEVQFAEKEIAKRYRPIYKGTIIINSAFDREKGNKVIQDGDADAVAFGKLFISNPDLPERFEQDASLAEWDEARSILQAKKDIQIILLIRKRNLFNSKKGRNYSAFLLLCGHVFISFQLEQPSRI
jgi:N-ethylmaleimide reductase